MVHAVKNTAFWANSAVFSLYFRCIFGGAVFSAVFAPQNAVFLLYFKMGPFAVFSLYFRCIFAVFVFMALYLWRCN